MREGADRVRPQVSVERLGPSCAIVDADDGPGQVATTRAVDEAVDLARATGAGVVGVRNSNHFGAAAAYTLRAAAAGMVGMALSHAEADVVAFGGRSPALGTNPRRSRCPDPTACRCHGPWSRRCAGSEPTSAGPSRTAQARRR